MTDITTTDFTNGAIAKTDELTAAEVLACSLENPEYCEACQ